MHCCGCKEDAISPNMPPYGFFWCKSDHIQCLRCNNISKNRCRACRERTQFVQMTFLGLPMSDGETHKSVDYEKGDGDKESVNSNRVIKQTLVDSSCYKNRLPLQKSSKILANEISSQPNETGQKLLQKTENKTGERSLSKKKHQSKKATKMIAKQNKEVTTTNIGSDIEKTKQNAEETDTIGQQLVDVSTAVKQANAKSQSKCDPTNLTIKLSSSKPKPNSHPLPLHSIDLPPKEQYKALKFAKSSNIKHVCNVFRARFRPFSLAETDNTELALYNPHKPVVLSPPPQYELVHWSNSTSYQCLFKRAENYTFGPQPASQVLSIRLPVVCPDTACQQYVFITDFSAHLVMCHPTIPTECISPNQCKNFFLNPYTVQFNDCKCQMIYLLKEKICDFGSNEYKDYLPIVVLTTRLGKHSCEKRESANLDGILAIWVAGIVPQTQPIYVTLTVFESSSINPEQHMTVSSELYSVRKCRRMDEIIENAQPLLLNSQEVKLLTNNFTQLMQLQIMTH